MSTFTPPAQSTVPPILPSNDPDQTPEGFRLFRHYRSRPEGINVYLLSDDTITEDDPDQERVFWAEAEGTPYVKRAFYGGHDDYDLTDAEATLLTDAGYTVTP